MTQVQTMTNTWLRYIIHSILQPMFPSYNPQPHRVLNPVDESILRKSHQLFVIFIHPDYEGKFKCYLSYIVCSSL